MTLSQNMRSRRILVSDRSRRRATQSQAYKRAAMKGAAVCMTHAELYRDLANGMPRMVIGPWSLRRRGIHQPVFRGVRHGRGRQV